MGSAVPLSSAVRQSCREFLQPGEEIDYAFPAISVGSPGMISALIVVSATRVTVLACKLMRRNVPDSVWATFPRNIQLSPIESNLGPIIATGSYLWEIDEEYVSVVRAADAEITEGGFLPPDPLPDL